MTGTAILFLVTGVVIGGIIFWFVAASRFHRKGSELESRAGSAEAVVSELRQQGCEKEVEIERLRNELSLERQTKIEALTRLEISENQLKEGMERFEKVRNELSENRFASPRPVDPAAPTSPST